MKWRNSKERELLATGGSREQTLPNKNNPNPDLSDADGDRPRLDLSDVSPLTSPQRPEEQTENEEDEEINVTWWNSNEYPDANVFVWRDNDPSNSGLLLYEEDNLHRKIELEFYNSG